MWLMTYNLDISILSIAIERFDKIYLIRLLESLSEVLHLEIMAKFINFTKNAAYQFYCNCGNLDFDVGAFNSIFKYFS